MTLNQEELAELKAIAKDKYAIGAFSGMITNLQFNHPESTTEEILQKAVGVRLKIKELTSVKVPPIPIHVGKTQ